ncbi:MAG: barstar family protein [Chloroflexi bacterium]|nr:barstar family protein [Chloroflexota bacterium]
MMETRCFSFADQLPDPQALVGAQVARLPSHLWGKAELLTALAEQLAFPSYFGMNWDALEDCLGRLLPNQGRRVVIIHEALPAGMDDHDVQTYLQVLADVCGDRLKAEEPPLTAVFPAAERARVLQMLGRADPPDE